MSPRLIWLPPGLVVSSVVFGLLHGRWLAGMLAGMAYAVALYRRGQMGGAVYAHVLCFGRWSLWS